MNDLQAADRANAPLHSETIPVGGAEGGSGKYVRGSFVPPENACGGVWEFTATNEVLQWRAAGIHYEVFGSVDQLGHDSVTQMDLVKMAESITGVVTIPPDQPDPGHLWSLAEMEQFAGKHVFAPTVLPEGYVFSHGVMTDEQTLLVYQPADPGPASTMVSKPVVYLFQCGQPAAELCSKDRSEIPEDVRETVQINGVPGFYAKGSLMETQYTNGKEEWIAEDGFFHTQRLFWQANGTSFKLMLLWGEGIDKDQMIAMANSIE